MSVTDQHRVRLLDVDPDLGADLDPSSLGQAGRFLRLPAVDLTAGPWTADEVVAASDPHGPVFGCVVVSGLITRDLRLGDRVCTHLHGPRDFVSLHGLDLASLPFAVEFAALTDSRLALLDDRVLAAGQRWPRLLGRLLDTTTSQ